MPINISTRLLRAFLLLEEHRNFTRAAERCHVAQSTFSAMIQKLEETAGMELFERDTRSVALTPEGELFVDVARQIVADIESAFTDLQDYAMRRKNKVAIAALPSLTAGWIPPVIAAYKNRYPDITVELFDTLSDACLELLRRGKVDFALSAPIQATMEFDIQPFYNDHFYLICHRNHPLAKRTHARLQDLAGCSFIHLLRTSSVRQHLDLALREIPLQHSGLEVEHLATVASLIVSELGVTLVPEMTLFQFRHPDLVIIPMEEADFGRPILIVKQKGQKLSAAARHMLEFMQAKIAEDPLTTFHD